VNLTEVVPTKKLRQEEAAKGNVLKQRRKKEQAPLQGGNGNCHPRKRNKNCDLTKKKEGA